MMKSFKCAALSVALSVLPSGGYGDASMVSFRTWEGVCRPSADVPRDQAGDCFSSAIRMYLVDFAPLAFQYDVELHCEDSVEHFWMEFDAVSERMIDFMMSKNNNWNAVVAQAIYYSGAICSDISQ